MRFSSFLFFGFFFFLSQNIFADYNIFDSEEKIERERLESEDDPFEKLNREIFAFNNLVDKYSLRPLAIAYRKVTPIQVKRSISNVINNLQLPIVIASSILQLDYKNSYNATSKFVLNSSFGLFGIFDLASKVDLKARTEDLAQALIKYRIPEGPFLMMPFFGPTTPTYLMSDLIQDISYNQIFNTHFDAQISDDQLVAIALLDLTVEREKILNITDDIEHNSLDPYVVIKNSFFQRKRALNNNLE